jgi:hypothetical protein
MIQLYPNVSYHPIPRLVTLFAQSGMWTTNPRAPHIRSQAAAASSYAAVAKKPMERANTNVGSNQANMNHGQGAGQGSMVEHREFQPAHYGFHLGYAGRGPYIGHGGGRYGACNRCGGWAPQTSGGSFSRRGRGADSDVQGTTSLNRDNVQQKQVEMKTDQGASTEAALVSVGGMIINLPAQAVAIGASCDA